MKTKKTKTSRTISLPVAAPFKNLIEELAKRDNRKPTQFARLILERAVADEANRVGLTPVPASALAS